jgi:hypothetical protein
MSIAQAIKPCEKRQQEAQLEFQAAKKHTVHQALLGTRPTIKRLNYLVLNRE